MSGEIHDYHYPHSPSWMIARQTDAGHIMIAAMCWLFVYYTVIKPFRFWQPSKESLLKYDETGLTEMKEWKYITWREYENSQ